MAKGVNKVMLLGNVGKDPEMRATQSGMVIAQFPLATAERQKDQGGNWVDKTEWHNLVCFGKTAEIVRDYVKKGKQLFIEGSLRTSSWEDKQSGQKRYKTEIVVNDLSLLGGGGRDSEGGGSQYSGGSYSNRAASGTASFDQRSSQPPQDEYANEGITDDDIPF